MAETAQFTSIAGGFLQSAVGWALAGTVILVLIAVIFGLALYVRYMRKFNIFVEIRSERASAPAGAIGNSGVDRMMKEGSYRIVFDRGAIIYDKTDKGWFFRIRGEKIDLPVPPFNVLQPSNKGNVLKIWQKSNEEYVYMMPDKIDSELAVDVNGKNFNISQLNTKQVEGDISYWNIKRKEKNRKLFDAESLFAKIVPHIPAMVSGALSIILIWIVFDKLPPLIGQLGNLAETIQRTTQATVTSGAA